MSERVVVVGAGLAAHRTVSGLRSKGFTGSVTVVGDEKHAPYNRPPLSKVFLAGASERDALFFKPGTDDTEWRFGCAASGLDLAAHEIVLAGGETLVFDTLVIATGRRARHWPGPAPATGVFTLRTLDDSVALREAVGQLGADGRVVIVGAGFIGSEAAATMTALGVSHISLVDVVPQPLAPLGEEIGSRVADAHRAHGVDLHMGVGVKELRGENHVEAVELSDGTVLGADLVLLALGSIPNTEWTQGSGLLLHRGSILCDEYLYAAGRDDVLAAGDVAAWPDVTGEGHLSVEHWTNTGEMAALVAGNLLAERADRKPYRGLPTFWSDIYDLKIKSAGVVAGADRVTIINEDPEKHALIAEAHIGSELVGAVAINEMRAMIDYAKRLGAARTPA